MNISHANIQTSTDHRLRANADASQDRDEQKGCRESTTWPVKAQAATKVMRVKCLVVQQGELAPRTQEHPSQERVGTSMLTQCTLGFEVAHAIRSSQSG